MILTDEKVVLGKLDYVVCLSECLRNSDQLHLYLPFIACSQWRLHVDLLQNKRIAGEGSARPILEEKKKVSLGLRTVF